MFAQVRYAEDLSGSSNTLIDIDQVGAIGIEGADAVSALNAILQTGQPVQRSDVALTMQGFAQFMPPHWNRQVIQTLGATGLPQP